jgi:putative AlgH/UPF0301 family transcriptional regulator
MIALPTSTAAAAAAAAAAVRPPPGLLLRRSVVAAARRRAPPPSSSSSPPPLDRRRRSTLVRATSGSSGNNGDDDDDDDDAPPVPLGDWRAFRAKLVSAGGVVSTEELEASGSGEGVGGQGGSGPPSSSSSSASPPSSAAATTNTPPTTARSIPGRPSAANQRLLRIQNPRLADEDAWAHRLPRPERGCLLVATHDAPRILGSDAAWQAVVLVVDVTPAGSIGLLLNRPTAMAVARRPGGLPFEIQGAPEGMQRAFGDNRVYMGGPVAQQVLHLLHPHRLDGAQELVPGVFLGGERAATRAVASGELEASDFKFYAGATLWEAGQAEREVARGAWIPVAAARPLLLKQVLQLPTPLWREVLDLLGDEEAARQVEAAYSEDGPDE